MLGKIIFRNIFDMLRKRYLVFDGQPATSVQWHIIFLKSYEIPRTQKIPAPGMCSSEKVNLLFFALTGNYFWICSYIKFTVMIHKYCLDIYCYITFMFNTLTKMYLWSKRICFEILSERKSIWSKKTYFERNRKFISKLPIGGKGISFYC